MIKSAKTNVEQAYRTAVIAAGAALAKLLLLVVIYFDKPDIFKFDFLKPLHAKLGDG